MVQIGCKRNAQHQFSLEVKKVSFGAEIDKKVRHPEAADR